MKNRHSYPLPVSDVHHRLQQKELRSFFVSHRVPARRRITAHRPLNRRTPAFGRGLLKAIEDGADGVYVAGCLEGECHFMNGNLKARKRVEYVKKILEEVGIEPERVEMFNLSAGEGPRFAEIAAEMTNRIKELGPSPVNARKAA